MKRKPKKNKKTTLSLSIDPILLDIVNENISNRSKYIVNCMIDEMCKNELIKQELKNKKIIL